MDALKAAIIRYKLPLKFDNPTEGQGNCFPNVQQYFIQKTLSDCCESIWIG